MSPARRDLGAFRERFHGCLDRRAGAQFELCDAAPGTVTGTAQRHRHRSGKAVSCGEESSIEGIAALCLANFDSASGLALLKGELGGFAHKAACRLLGARGSLLRSDREGFCRIKTSRKACQDKCLTAK